MKKDNSNLRVILAVAFSFLFIVLYSNYFVKPDEKQASQASKESSAQAANQAPQIKQEAQSAPQLESSQEAKSIPVSYTHLTLPTNRS